MNVPHNALPELHKWVRSAEHEGSQRSRLIFYTTSCSEPLCQIQFHRIVHDTLNQNCTNGHALLNKRAARALDNKHL